MIVSALQRGRGREAVSFGQQRSHAAPCKSSLCCSEPHHCLSVWYGLLYQSVGTVLPHPAKALGLGPLRLVLASLVREQSWGLPLRHTLRFYLTPHFVTWQAVGRTAPLVPATALPLRITMRRYVKCLRWQRARQAMARPTRHRLSPCGCAGTLVSIRRLAHCFGQWPVTMYLVAAPPTQWTSPRFAGIGPARSARPPPRGSLRTALTGVTPPSAEPHTLKRKLQFKIPHRWRYSAGMGHQKKKPTIILIVGFPLFTWGG